MGSELTMSPAEMLAAIVNTLTGNSDASHLRQSIPELVGALYAATVGGASPHLSMSVADMLAAIRNNVSDDPDVDGEHTNIADLLAQIRNAWSDSADVSAKSLSVPELLAEMLLATPVDGGGGGDADTVIYGADTAIYGADQVVYTAE